MNYTENLQLRKPTDAESGNVADLNYNADRIDEEIAKRGKTVNGKQADANGNYQVDEVAFAQNLVADDAQQMSGEFLFRTTGGDASLTDGEATLVSLLGRMTHTGVIEESITLTVTQTTRSGGEEGITAEIDRDTFVAYVDDSGTITLTYTDAWSANPTLYGVTVTGTPISGDQIQIVYVKENRGTITPATPSAFRSTGWNLYNHTLGYARVKKYSESYGFLIGGTYTAVKFATTVSGAQNTIIPVNGYFTIPSDGYIFVTGGNATDTYILMTWSDWTSGYEGDFAAYSEDTINLSTIMSNYFPYGLCQIGGVADEIALSAGYAISRIARMAYNATNLETAMESGRDWEADENYIYLVKATPEASAITISGNYDACDHGTEIIDGSSVAVFAQTLYGQNLKDKLRTDVLTISRQDLTEPQKSQVRENSGSAGFIQFGVLTKTIQENLESNWTTDVPNDGKTYNIALTAMYGVCYGIISRYSNNYGTAVLVRYDGKLYEAYLNNGTVTVNNTKGMETSVPTTFNTNLRSVSSVRKGGIIAQTLITVKSDLSSDWYNGLATGLPDSFCPVSVTFGSMRINTSSDSGKAAYGILNTNGQFQMYLGSSFSSDIVFSFTYICKD